MVRFLLQLGNSFGFFKGIHSMCLTKFQSVGMIDWYLLVGTSNSMILNPRQCQGGSIHVYRIHAGERFEYLHTTYLEDTPTAITPFQVTLFEIKKGIFIIEILFTFGPSNYMWIGFKSCQ